MNAHTDISGNILWSEVPAFRLIDKELDRVKELMNEQLSTSAKTGIVNQLLEYLNSNSGKMIRPGLVLLAGSAVSAITDEHIRIAAIFGISSFLKCSSITHFFLPKKAHFLEFVYFFY